jgi:hypothetical protein
MGFVCTCKFFEGVLGKDSVGEDEDVIPKLLRLWDIHGLASDGSRNGGVYAYCAICVLAVFSSHRSVETYKAAASQPV